MFCDNKILIAKGNTPVYLLPEMANRHGLIAGATVLENRYLEGVGRVL